MMHAVIERKGDVRGFIVVAERTRSGQRNLGEIAATLLAEDGPEHGGRLRQQTHDGTEHIPLRLGVVSRRKTAKPVERCGESRTVRIATQALKQFAHPRLCARVPFLLILVFAGWKADILVKAPRLAPQTFLRE